MNKPILKKIIVQQLKKYPNNRTTSFKYRGERYWLKQTESSSIIKFLLMKDSSTNLNKEKLVLQKFIKLKIPVPNVVDSGNDYLVLSDVGDNILCLLENKKLDHSEKQKILIKTSTALAKLHEKLCSHGRPSIKDICLKNNKIYFIDFEEFQLSKNIKKQQMRDLLIFIHSLYRFFGINNESIKKIIKAYQQNGGEKVWVMTNKKIQTWLWLRYIFYFFRKSGGKDITPIYWVFNFFKSQKNF